MDLEKSIVSRLIVKEEALRKKDRLISKVTAGKNNVNNVSEEEKEKMGFEHDLLIREALIMAKRLSLEKKTFREQAEMNGREKQKLGDSIERVNEQILQLTTALEKEKMRRLRKLEKNSVVEAILKEQPRQKMIDDISVWNDKIAVLEEKTRIADEYISRKQAQLNICLMAFHDLVDDVDSSSIDKIVEKEALRRQKIQQSNNNNNNNNSDVEFKDVEGQNGDDNDEDDDDDEPQSNQQKHKQKSSPNQRKGNKRLKVNNKE